MGVMVQPFHMSAQNAINVNLFNTDSSSMCHCVTVNASSSCISLNSAVMLYRLGGLWIVKLHHTIDKLYMIQGL